MGGAKELTKTENAQPAMLTISFAAYQVYKQELGITPVICAGHSLGEISALTCFGAMSLFDAVRLVRMRGLFMSEAVSEGEGAMAAIVGNDAELTDLVEYECARYSCGKEVVAVSNYNSKKQLVISGHKRLVEKVGDRLSARRLKVIPLHVSAPFHCRLMQPAAEKMKALLETVEIHDSLIPVISNSNARPYQKKDKIRNNIYRNMTEPVRWTESVQYMCANGVNLAFEMGAKPVLRELVADITDKIPVFSITDSAQVHVAKSSIADIKQKKKMDAKNVGRKLLMHCMAAAVCTKNLNADTTQYEENVTKNYIKMKQMRNRVEAERVELSAEEIKQVIHMLKSIFCYKKIPLSQQNERWNEIFSETGLQSINYHVILS